MKNYQEILSNNNLSVTSARLDILATLNKLDKPVTIDQLAQALSEDVHQTTLYRSLKALVDAGIVYQTDFRDGAAYFEYQGSHHHHHLICTSCKERSTLDTCVSPLFPDIEKKHDFKITNHVFELFGLCKNCS